MPSTWVQKVVSFIFSLIAFAFRIAGCSSLFYFSMLALSHHLGDSNTDSEGSKSFAFIEQLLIVVFFFKGCSRHSKKIIEKSRELHISEAQLKQFYIQRNTKWQLVFISK